MAVSYQNIDISFPKIKRRVFARWIKKVIEKEGKNLGAITCIFSSDTEILRINRQYLKHDYYTDIITFDYTENNIVSGDLFISLDTVRFNSEKFKTAYEDELRRVIIHGILHLCGYNDLTKEQRVVMRMKESESLAIWNNII